ncbi:glycosyl transferase [Prauserella sp. PE36]|uniref:Glycosyltransferase family 2 protein n=1 Tax=Prauserella endophytica TaxID=1592324 RepID=A0ABY2SDA3_9PSEU|nr:MULTISPECIES: glycosyltransferase family 2 protein [Prauserella]PXY17066.1 glycosyl transferase [Prauserella coralliicola]RBM21307.1 glycosyl transferase [Prauserella sp. PE36]TKG73716.1 glycosyltransferase family 2 protein [Prauserella endophytica]
MSSVPRLSIGLPIYNGERYLAESLDALLGQTYEDFELIISDNASTDGTQEICREYAARDGRIRYLRQRTNIGACPNHNVTVHEARGELFKWASHDDLYGRDLLKVCVDALDERPDVVLAHSYKALIDEHGAVTRPVEYTLTTDSPSAPERFRSVLFGVGGDDFYGVIRTDVLRRTPLNGSYHHSDRTITAELALLGRFHQVPELLFFRRDHPGRAERAKPTIRARCANMDPIRADRLRHPTVRLLGEYVWGFIDAIRRTPLSQADRWKCYGHLAHWAASRVRIGSGERAEDAAPVELDVPILVETIVAGQRERAHRQAEPLG